MLQKMFRTKTLITFSLIIFLLYAQISEDQVQKAVNKLNMNKQYQSNLNQKLIETKVKLADCVRQLSKVSKNNCLSQRQNVEKLQQKVRQLQKNTQVQCKKVANEVCEIQYKQKHQSLLQKLKGFEKSAENQAKNFVTRLKNFITGKGPYNKEDEELFSQFKIKVNDLQAKIQENADTLDRIYQQKQDIDLQQRYCRAKLSDIDDQIHKLQREAQSKRKTYYIREIQRLYDERQKARINNECKDSKVNDEIREKLIKTEDQLREQLDLYQAESNRFRKCVEDYQNLKDKVDRLQSQNFDLRTQNAKFKKLIQDIYSIKDQ